MVGGWYPIYEIENNPAMFETTNQIKSIFPINIPLFSHYKIHMSHKYQPWINKPLGWWIGGVPLKYWIMTIGGVPP